MNKQELIEKYEGELPSIGMNISNTIKFKELWDDILELDEPEKVTIPQFVADWIRKCKTFKSFAVSLSFALQPSVWEANGLSNECIEWLADAENQELFARAWLDGYTVEDEKKYKVVLLNYNDGHLNLVNVRTLGENIIFFTKKTQFDPRSLKLTKAEIISSGFGWVFDCPGIKIEEVE